MKASGRDISGKKKDDAMQHTEGEANTSAARADWAAREDHGATKALLDRDAEAFLHQSLSLNGGL